MKPTASIFAQINPAMLVWARKESDLTQEDVARRMDVKIERLTSWETGAKLPTYKQLTKLAREIYKRPSAIFFRKSLPVEPAFEVEFRTVTSKKLHGISAAMRFAIRQAKHLQSVQKELFDYAPPPFHFRDFNFDPDAPAAKTANDLREFFALNIEEQFQWKDPRAAFHALRARLEESGICVLVLDFPLEEARGFTLSGDVPVIVVNGKDEPAGRIFTLIHELCHALRQMSSIFFGLSKQGIQPSFIHLEKCCNALAAAFLLPEPHFTKEVERLAKGEPTLWSDRKLAILANKFKTSKETVMRKLLDMKLVEPAFYGANRKRWKETREANEIKKKEKMRTADKPGGAMPPHQKTVREKGRTFTSKVFQLYDDGNITALDTARFLDAKLTSFDKFIETLREHK